jgi:hypothetical protein
LGCGLPTEQCGHGWAFSFFTRANCHLITYLAWVPRHLCRYIGDDRCCQSGNDATHRLPFWPPKPCQSPHTEPDQSHPSLRA